jgi:hypothetical protein
MPSICGVCHNSSFRGTYLDRQGPVIMAAIFAGFTSAIGAPLKRRS